MTIHPITPDVDRGLDFDQRSLIEGLVVRGALSSLDGFALIHCFEIATAIVCARALDCPHPQDAQAFAEFYLARPAHLRRVFKQALNF